MIINMFGEPGVGKSVLAMDLVSRMKKLGIKVEYVSEYAKEVVYSGNYDLLKNQFLISAQQWTRITEAYNTCDYVVTDSPLLLGVIYSKDCPGRENFVKYLFDLHNSFPTLNILVDRVIEEYQEWGRLETRQESERIRKEIECLPVGGFTKTKNVDDIIEVLRNENKNY